MTAALKPRFSDLVGGLDHPGPVAGGWRQGADRETGQMRIARNLLKTTPVALALTFGLTAVGGAQAPGPNPLAAGPMPRCGPQDAAFERRFTDLKLRRSWRGFHENQAGKLELATGPDGAWYLFYLGRDRQDRPRVCLIARGHRSRILFGSPV